MNERVRQAMADTVGDVDVHHGGNRAYFSPSSDHVQLPTFQQFDTPVAYYATF